jgi:hypothetical protein
VLDSFIYLTQDFN